MPDDDREGQYPDPHHHHRGGAPDPGLQRAQEHARAWLSAARDGEVGEDTAARAHVAACRDCTRWQSALGGVERTLAATPAPVPPGLASPALAVYAHQQARPSARERAARLLLAAAGAAGLILVVLTLARTTGAHIEHDLLGFEAAFAVGFLLCARDPARYGRALLPITAVAAFVVLVPSVAAAASAPVDLLSEAGHQSVLAGLTGLVLLAGAPPRATSAVGGPDHPLGLRLAAP